jgi:hypothetical protein
MGQLSPVVQLHATNLAANFGREILKPSSVENVGKKLPGYSFGRLARALWPQKTPASIEFYTGCPERTARHIAADKSDPGSILLARILDSEQGWRALQWIMRDSKQVWWADTKRAVRCAGAFDHASKQVEMDI